MEEVVEENLEEEVVEEEMMEEAEQAAEAEGEAPAAEDDCGCDGCCGGSNDVKISIDFVVNIEDMMGEAMAAMLA